jgi:hypothetical protein
MTSKKYALHPGWVTSQQDGDFHFIGVSKLVRLYELRPDEFIYWKNDYGRIWEDYIHLWPRDDGKYGRPK